MICFALALSALASGVIALPTSLVSHRVGLRNASTSAQDAVEPHPLPPTHDSTHDPTHDSYTYTSSDYEANMLEIAELRTRAGVRKTLSDSVPVWEFCFDGRIDYAFGYISLGGSVSVATEGFIYIITFTGNIQAGVSAAGYASIGVSITGSIGLTFNVQSQIDKVQDWALEKIGKAAFSVGDKLKEKWTGVPDLPSDPNLRQATIIKMAVAAPAGTSPSEAQRIQMKQNALYKSVMVKMLDWFRNMLQCPDGVPRVNCGQVQFESTFRGGGACPADPQSGPPADIVKQTEYNAAVATGLLCQLIPAHNFEQKFLRTFLPNFHWDGPVDSTWKFRISSMLPFPTSGVVSMNDVDEAIKRMQGSGFGIAWAAYLNKVTTTDLLSKFGAQPDGSLLKLEIAGQMGITGSFGAKASRFCNPEIEVSVARGYSASLISRPGSAGATAWSGWDAAWVTTVKVQDFFEGTLTVSDLGWSVGLKWGQPATEEIFGSGSGSIEYWLKGYENTIMDPRMVPVTAALKTAMQGICHAFDVPEVPPEPDGSDGYMWNYFRNIQVHAKASAYKSLEKPVEEWMAEAVGKIGPSWQGVLQQFHDSKRTQPEGESMVTRLFKNLLSWKGVNMGLAEPKYNHGGSLSINHPFEGTATCTFDLFAEKGHTLEIPGGGSFNLKKQKVFHVYPGF